jgi:hypothetical protein
LLLQTVMVFIPASASERVLKATGPTCTMVVVVGLLLGDRLGRSRYDENGRQRGSDEIFAQHGYAPLVGTRRLTGSNLVLFRTGLLARI